MQGVIKSKRTWRPHGTGRTADIRYRGKGGSCNIHEDTKGHRRPKIQNIAVKGPPRKGAYNSPGEAKAAPYKGQEFGGERKYRNKKGTHI